MALECLLEKQPLNVQIVPALVGTIEVFMEMLTVRDLCNRTGELIREAGLWRLPVYPRKKPLPKRTVISLKKREWIWSKRRVKKLLLKARQGVYPIHHYLPGAEDYA